VPLSASSPAATAPAGTRVAAIDVFRGLVILVMVFVNDAASIRGLPWWLAHMSPWVNGMTFVDVVFPAFLFIVGMAIPLALDRRLARGEPHWAIAGHVARRTASLLAMGLLIMNGRRLDPGTSGVPYAVWNVGMLVGVVALWHKADRRGSVRAARVQLAVRTAALGGLVLLVLLYRSSVGGWIDFRDWGILGSIGWAYLTVTILTLLSRRRLSPLLLSLAGLVAWNVATRHCATGLVPVLKQYFYPVGNGSAAAITLCGVVVSVWHTQRLCSFGEAMRRTLAFGLLMTWAGLLLAPRYGISKIGGTPSFVLFSAAICCVLFLLFHWLVDLKGQIRWASFLRPASQNALLTYLLPDVFYAIFGLRWLDATFGFGYVGLVRASAFAFAILGVSAVLTRLRVRLVL
jgi:heparan-alpha-glucosaminide N-acetyltransferase